MTRTEACQILNIEETGTGEEPVNHVDVIDRFEVLYEKNSIKNGGSFYLRSKIFFAKEHLMQDWPEELNVTKFDNEDTEETQEDGEQQAATDQQAASDTAAEKDGKTKSSDDKDPPHPNKQ